MPPSNYHNSVTSSQPFSHNSRGRFDPAALQAGCMAPEFTRDIHYTTSSSMVRHHTTNMPRHDSFTRGRTWGDHPVPARACTRNLGSLCRQDSQNPSLLYGAHSTLPHVGMLPMLPRDGSRAIDPGHRHALSHTGCYTGENEVHCDLTLRAFFSSRS